MADREILKSNSRLQSLGLKATKVYIISILAFIPAGGYLGWIRITALELNQLGDLLAGLFGPLAIFWLILGYFQQGDELRSSVEALRLQAEELKNSVDQQKAMVSTAERQLQLDIEVREEQNRLLVSRELPFFQLERRGGSSAGGVGWNHGFLVRNIGQSAANLLLTTTGKSISYISREVPFLESTHTFEFVIQSHGTSRLTHDGPAFVEVFAENNRGRKRYQKFELSDDHHPTLVDCDPPQM